MGEQVLEFVAKIPFVAKIFEMAFGIDVAGEVSVSSLLSICFTHGVVLALTWTVVIAAATRVTVGEIEKGTADLLLTLPVRRMEVFWSTTVVWGCAAAVLSCCPILGIAIGLQIFETAEVVEVSQYFAPAVNFFCLNLAVGALATMIGCLVDRRGQAVGIVVGIVMFSMVLNFVEPFIEFVQRVRFLSLLCFFRPVDIVRTGEWPVSSLIVLVGFAMVCWTLGAIVYCRRDIPTA